jgi:putative chitinase
MLKLNKLKGIIPDSVIEQIPSIIEINGPLRLSHFISQCAHESAGFKRTEENFNYSASGLRKIFRKYFDYDEFDKFHQIHQKRICY